MSTHTNNHTKKRKREKDKNTYIGTVSARDISGEIGMTIGAVFGAIAEKGKRAPERELTEERREGGRAETAEIKLGRPVGVLSKVCCCCCCCCCCGRT